MSVKEIEAPVSAAAIEGTRCEAIGNIMVCLHYLSCQARATNCPELSLVIDKAVQEAMGLGLEAYNGYVRELLRNRSQDGAGFVEDFCNVNDETIKGELREIASRQAQARQTGT